MREQVGAPSGEGWFEGWIGTSGLKDGGKGIPDRWKSMSKAPRLGWELQDISYNKAGGRGGGVKACRVQVWWWQFMWQQKGAIGGSKQGSSENRFPSYVESLGPEVLRKARWGRESGEGTKKAEKAENLPREAVCGNPPTRITVPQLYWNPHTDLETFSGHKRIIR